MQHLQPNATLQGGKYRIERVLGQGGFGNAIIHCDMMADAGILRIEKHDDRLCFRNQGLFEATCRDHLS